MDNKIELDTIEAFQERLIARYGSNIDVSNIAVISSEEVDRLNAAPKNIEPKVDNGNNKSFSLK